MAARDRHRPLGVHVPRDHGKVGGGSWRIRTLLLERRRSGTCGVEQFVERDDAVGEILAEPADEADLKRFGRGLQRIVELIVRPDAPVHDQRTRARAAEGGRYVGSPPQQGQRHRDHPGSQHRKKGQHEFDAVGELQPDKCIRPQADVP